MGKRARATVLTQRVQSTDMVQSMVSVVVTSLMAGGSIPYIGTSDALGYDHKESLEVRRAQPDSFAEISAPKILSAERLRVRV